MKTIKYQKENCKIKVSLYQNGTPALFLLSEDGSPMSTATVNLPNEKPKKGCVFIKDYSENKGLAEVLIRQDVGIPKRTIDTGYIKEGVIELEIIDNYIIKEIKSLQRKFEGEIGI